MACFKSTKVRTVIIDSKPAIDAVGLGIHVKIVQTNEIKIGPKLEANTCFKSTSIIEGKSMKYAAMMCFKSTHLGPMINQ